MRSSPSNQRSTDPKTCELGVVSSLNGFDDTHVNRLLSKPVLSVSPFNILFVGVVAVIVIVWLEHCSLTLYAESSVSPQQLVRQLGSPNFTARSQAEQRLLDLGYESYSAIVAGAESDDPEVRYRAERLLKLLQRAAFADNQHQLRQNPWRVPAAFAPGWEAYHQLLGDGPDSRELYVQILNSETNLLLTLSYPGWRLEFERRCADLQAFSHQRRRIELQPGSIAALLFLACHEDNQPSGLASSVIYMLIADGNFRDAVENSQSSDVLKALIGHWIRKSENSSPMQRLGDAAAFNLDAAVDVARGIIQDRDRVNSSPIHLENAIFYLARHGGQEVIEELETLLTDRHQLRGSSRGSEMDVQIRDVALVALLHLTDQEPQTYRYYELQPKTGYLYIGNSARFASAADREFALNKWQEWRAASLKDPVPNNLDASEGDLL